MRRKMFTEIIIALLVLLFSYAAISKILDYENFATQLGRSPLLGNTPYLYAVAILFSEFLIVVLLLFKRTKILGLYLSLGLLAIFTAYILYILNFRPTELPCVCGGIISKLSWGQHVWFNSFFLLINGIAIYLKSNQQGWERSPNEMITIAR